MVPELPELHTGYATGISLCNNFLVADSMCDLTITPDEDQYVLWAIGGIEETAFKHFIRTEGK